jgi:LysM repeat protein
MAVMAAVVAGLWAPTPTAGRAGRFDTADEAASGDRSARRVAVEELSPAPALAALGPVAVHVVRAGESAYGIAAQYGMPPSELAGLNAVTGRSVLLPGQRLWVPMTRARGGPEAADGLAGRGTGDAAHAGSEADVGATDVASADGQGGDGPAADGQAVDGQAATPTAVPAPTEARTAPETVRHTIAAGDTLYSLSERFGVSVDVLRAWNALGEEGVIRAGDSLVVAVPAGPTDAPGGADPSSAASGGGSATHDTYTVVAGDTLTSIAARHGTTAAALQRSNGLPDDTLQVGQAIVVPRSGTGLAAAPAAGAKRIEIAIGEQRMYVWQGETLVWSWVVSTGIDSHPTQRGEFSVQSKVAEAWSSAWQLWMPHWLGIYYAGSSENGIHALPIINGQRMWASNLGTPISYGCVVLGVEEAETLYHWADIGTPVTIRD